MAELQSVIIQEVKQFLDDEQFYGGPSTLTVNSVLERLKALLAEAERMQRSLLLAHARAAYFSRDGSECRPRKSAVAACTWIKLEIEGLLTPQSGLDTDKDGRHA